MTRVIVCTSGKGGVGKTTLVSNLAASLTELGEQVVVVDANLTTPNLGLHLGYHLAPKTLHDILRGDVKIKDATYYHPLGFSIIPASMNMNDLKDIDAGRLPEVTLNLLGKANYVILDCAAGLGREAISAISASTEVLVVTNPDLPSVADALKTVRIARCTGKMITGVVVNRVRNREHELTKKEIEEMLDAQVLVEIPEDSNVSKSIASKTPLVSFNPDSPASLEMRKLAHLLCNKPFRPKIPRNFRILDRLVGWMTG
jgi:septum site-determining protein MinD